MAKKSSIMFFGKEEDLISRQQINVQHYNKDAKIIVGTHLVAFIEKGGVLMDTLQSGTHSLFDKKDGVLRRIVGGMDSFEIIYVAKETKLKMLWGTPNAIEMRDPVTNILITITSNGEFTVRISDPTKFYREVIKHEKNYTIVDLQKRLLNILMYELRPELAKTMLENRYTFDVITRYLKDIGTTISPNLRKIFSDFGVEMDSFIINNVNIPTEKKDEIEAELKRIKFDYQLEEQKREQKRELKEYLIEYEKIKDKENERERYLLELQEKNNQAYLQLCLANGLSAVNNNKTKQIIDTISCPGCNEDVEKNSKFCNKCGKQLSGSKICKCGKENPLDSKFCNSCGNQL